MTNSTQTIQCSCPICATNADKLGKSLPLRAEVSEAYAAMLGADRKAIHNTVSDAHNPSLPNTFVRAL